MTTLAYPRIQSLMPEPDQSISKVKKVLVVDDDPISLLIMTEMFKNEFQLYYALNSAVAMDLCTKIAFDTIILDVFLGDEEPTGTQLFSYLKQASLGKNTAYFAISSSSQPGDDVKLKKLGFDNFFQKPLKKAEIMAAVFS